MATNDGGPAFPIFADWPGVVADGAGLRIRDWFAGQALQGIAVDGVRPKDAGKLAYQYADAMLAARQQEPADAQ